MLDNGGPMAREEKTRHDEPAPVARAQDDELAPSELAARAVLLAGLSAMAAGAHEVAWSRLLGRATGNTTVGVGITLAAFMVGSGLGALLAPRTALWRHPRRAYAAAELVIALGSGLLLAFCLFAPPPSRFGLGLATDVAVTGAISCIPALAMGATYPLLVEASSTRDVHAVRALYAAGLGGVVVGTLGGALGIAPVLGLDALTLLAAGMNVLLAGLALYWLPPRPPAPSAPSPARLTTGDRGAVTRFAAAGVLGLAAQTIWNRTVAPYAGVSTFTFAAIVAAYVLAQALGFAMHARAPARLRARLGDVALGLAPVLVLLSLALVELTSELPSRDGAPLGWLGAVALVVAAIVGPPAFALGVSQAAALERIEERDDAWGRRAAVVAGIGTIASAAGALFASLVGISVLGPRWTLVVASVPALLVLAAARERRVVSVVAALVAIVVAVIAPGPRWFLGAAFDGAPIYFAEHGVQDTTAVIAVDRPVEPRIRRLVSNGVSYSGDSLYAQRYMRLLAHLPALAARGEARALLICVGTGTTLDALRAYDYAQIDAVDISPSIDRTLRFFEHVSHGVLDDERVHLVVDDGARYLRRTTETYDVITLEPPPPRAPGASSLYSVEFYEAARERLRPGGAIAQWLPLHGMSGAELAVLARTFASVFEGASLHLSERNEAVLLAVRDGATTTRGSEPRWARARARSNASEVGLGAIDPVRDTHVLGGRALIELLGEGAIVRDTWPMPEYAPLAGADERDLSADGFVELVHEASQAEPSQAEPGSFAATLLPAVASFLRLERQRGTAADRARVTDAMTRWQQRDPGDPYVQHAFGHGPGLERRLERLLASGEITADDAARVRALMQRAADR